VLAGQGVVAPRRHRHRVSAGQRRSTCRRLQPRTAGETPDGCLVAGARGLPTLPAARGQAGPREATLPSPPRAHPSVAIVVLGGFSVARSVTGSSIPPPGPPPPAKRPGHPDSPCSPRGPRGDRGPVAAVLRPPPRAEPGRAGLGVRAGPAARWARFALYLGFRLRGAFQRGRAPLSAGRSGRVLVLGAGLLYGERRRPWRLTGSSWRLPAHLWACR